MANSISAACENYFTGFNDISTFNENDSYKNILGVLKVVSYFTIVIPLLLGLIYGASSLIGRVTTIENPSSNDQRVSSFGQRALGQNIDEQLDQLFTSSRKTQRLFTIGESRVGVIFNPNGESLRVGFITVRDPVVLISNTDIPEAVSLRITAKIPAGCSHSTLCLGSINGQSIFTVLGFARD